MPKCHKCGKDAVQKIKDKDYCGDCIKNLFDNPKELTAYYSEDCFEEMM